MKNIVVISCILLLASCEKPAPQQPKIIWSDVYMDTISQDSITPKDTISVQDSIQIDSIEVSLSSGKYFY